MRRVASLLLLFVAGTAFGQDMPLELKGDVVVIDWCFFCDWPDASYRAGIQDTDDVRLACDQYLCRRTDARFCNAFSQCLIASTRQRHSQMS